MRTSRQNLPSISIEIPLDMSVVATGESTTVLTHKTGRFPTSKVARAGLGSGIMLAYTSFIAPMSRMSTW